MLSALLRARELWASVRPYRTGDGSFVGCNKSSDFLGPGEQARNAAAPDVRVAPLDDKSAYVARDGLNRVRVDRAV